MSGESGQDLKVMVERFVDVCRGRGLKANVDKSEVRTLGGEDWSVRSVCMGHDWSKRHSSNTWGVFGMK